MRLSSWSVFSVVLATAVAVAAQESTEKQAPAAKQSKETKGDDQAQPSDEKPETPADEKPEEPADEKPAKKTPRKKDLSLKLVNDDETELLRTFSYMQGFALGQSIYQQFTEQGIHLDEEVFFASLKDGMAGKVPTMTEEERMNASKAIQKYLSEKLAANAQELAAKNRKEGTDFLAENKKKEGVKTLASGLQYKVLKSGKGQTPKKTDTVKVHYKGTFINDKEFDSSYSRGEPTSFPLSGVVKGMAEGLQQMKVGDKWQLFLPSGLAYGEKGKPPIIPPNAVLLFEVELLEIEKGVKTQPFPPTIK